MQVQYEDDELKILFEDLEDVQGYRGLMIKQIGSDLTKLVKKRYNELKAADNFSIYLSTGLGKPHSLSGNMIGCYGIHINSNNRLIVKPVSEDNKSETLKLCKVILIRGVVDYHGAKFEWLIP